ncbi:hypothetical protein CHU92_07480 [Flavobacterium cyanobacteriorum]|uniref:2Fe-2S ferredoxin n=2 Tax=Flavobacterium cyanobacteriorum TaxID=2022802 RepID=A0A255ZAE3_9FLAO|nr:hypothetical protein CHU92_07480 [Flavobacterium cyanobacteriorum]
MNAPEKVIFICNGKKCGRYSKGVRKGLKQVVKNYGIKKEVEIVYMGCTDNCKTAPNICLQPQNIWIGEVEEEDIPGIFRKYYI